MTGVEPAASGGGSRARETTAGGRSAPNALLAPLLPEPVALVETFADLPPDALFPAERRALARLVSEERRREFTTVRRCAHTALARLGLAPQPILPAHDGPRWARSAPRWPVGTVGSMTHCEGYRAAAVAREAEFASIGIDAEPHAPLPTGLLTALTLPEERRRLDRLSAAHPDVAWGRVVFSAKESVFKTWYPLTGRWLGFDECEIVPDPAEGTFAALLRVPGPVLGGVRIDRFTGRWRVLHCGGTPLVGTAVVQSTAPQI